MWDKQFTQLQDAHACVLSRVQLFAAPWTVARQAPLSMGLSRQEYQGGLSFSSPGDLSNPGIKSKSAVRPALVGIFFTTEPPGKPHKMLNEPFFIWDL